MTSKRPEVAEFIQRLHAIVFKPRGFKKSRMTFIKKIDPYSITFQIQGSNWNDPSRPWRFYLNAGIQFIDLPRRDPDKDFPTVHSWTRIGQKLSKSARPHYEVVSSAVDDLIRRMGTIIDDAIAYFSNRHEYLREKYIHRPCTYLHNLDDRI